MKRGSTLFLKAIIVLIGAAVLALCIFVLPSGIRTTEWGGYRPILLGMYVPALPFYIALYQMLKLLHQIDRNNVFSHLSVQALQSIKRCTLLIGTLYAIGLPFIFRVADHDDAPGVVLLGLIFTFVPLCIAAFAAVFQKMLEDAIALKSENDTTI